jgi:hypothetical protein
MNTLSLAHISILLGALGVAASLWQAIAPAQVRRMLDALPRHTLTGWALAAVDLLWVAWLINETSLGRFDNWKPALYFLTPLSFYLLIQYLDELLTVRALGGLLLLLAAPVLDIARWHTSDWRLVIAGLAYLWVVMGMFLVMSPHLFRRAVRLVLPDDTRSRCSAALKLVVSAFLIALGLRVF